MKKILILSGKQGAGKTANSNAIFEQMQKLGYQPVVFKFAGILYQMHDRCMPILKEWGIRPSDMKKDGELLQVLGTEYGRKRIGESVWADATRRQVQNYLNTNSDKFVGIIDDTRFENEFDTFPDAYRVRLECDREARKARCSYWRDDENHPSETGLDFYAREGLFDYYIDTEKASLDVVSLEIRRRWMTDL